VERDDPRTALEHRTVATQLALERVEIAQQLAAWGWIGREQVQQHARALEVTQKLVTESPTFAGAVDETGYVGDAHGPLALAGLARQRDDTELGHERGERVGTDLRARSRDRADQRGLADVRVADDADVGE